MMKMASSTTMLEILLLLMPFHIALTLAQGSCGPNAGGALCSSGYCCSNYGYCGTTDAYCGAGNCQSQCPNNPPSAPTTSGSVGSIVTSAIFDQIFPQRNAFYDYNSFISAANSFSTFGTSSDPTASLRDIAAFLAQISHETTGLYYVREVDQSDSFCDSTNTQYPCAPNQKYFGRGPIQLTWNFNYGPAGAAIQINEDLLSNPDLVAQDPVVSFKTALWFWTTAQAPKPSPHDAIVGNWSPSAADIAAGRLPGFGVTIDIVNGGIECGPGATNPAAAADRVALYQNICGILEVDPGSNLSCTNMQPFSD